MSSPTKDRLNGLTGRRRLGIRCQQGMHSAFKGHTDRQNNSEDHRRDPVPPDWRSQSELIFVLPKLSTIDVATNKRL